MENQQETEAGTGSTQYVGGDYIEVGDISNATAVAIGRNAQALVYRIEQGDLIEHQEIVNITLDFGEFAPLAQEQVLEEIMALLKLDHGTVQDMVLKGASERVSRQLKELALAERKIAAQGVPTTPKAAYDLGMMAAYRRDYETALDYFRRATAADPAFAEAYKAISWLQQSRAMQDYKRREYEAALVKLDEAQEAVDAVAPRDARSIALEGFIAKTLAQIDEAKGEMGQWAEHLAKAEQLFKEAISLDDQDASAFNGLGNVYHARGQLEEAIDKYKRAIALTPNYTAAFNDLALAYEDKMEADEANANKWCERAVLAWEQAHDLAADDPGFSQEYGQKVRRRIRRLKLQCD